MKQTINPTPTPLLSGNAASLLSLEPDALLLSGRTAHTTPPSCRQVRLLLSLRQGTLCSPIGLIPSMKVYRVLHPLTKRACGRRLFCTVSALASQEVTQDLIPERRWNNSMVPTQVSDVFHSNTQLKQLVKTGHLDDARKLFFNMPQRDVISWTAIMSGYVSTSDYHEALNLFTRMWLEPSLRMDPFILSVALKACGLGNYANYGDLLHCVAVKTGLDDNVFVGSALLDMYTKTSRVSEGCMVFGEMPERNVVSWTAIIAGLVNTGHSRAGLVYFAEMGRCNNVHFDSYTFATALKACAALSNIDHGREVHTQTIKKGFDEISFVANTLATMYSKCGKLDYALTVFRRMRTPDVVSWTTIIATYVQIGKETIANQEFMRMIELDVRPNEYTFATIISGCSDLKWGEQLHNQVTKAGLLDSLSVSNSIMAMYSKFGLLRTTSMVFDAMSRRDIISWSTIISGYCQGGLAEEAFELLSQMRREGPKPTEYAFGSVLSVCGQMAILEQGRQLHAHVLTLGLEHRSMIQSALINMYAKCGSIKEASVVFKGVTNDIISWTAMINGYAEHGRSQEAIDVFDRIQEAGLKPDSVTFIGILTACSHAGLVDLGYHYFKCMGNKYDIDPSKEHYGCMIDLLCRAGRLSEAEKMIDGMPFKQDDVVWSTLLRACRIQGDVERGRRAADKILQLNPNCAGTHITLANVYSVRGEWREAAQIRREMKAKGVIKEPGSSWIKVKDRVSAFVSGDRSHPDGETLYAILELLAYGAHMAAQDTDSILFGDQD